MCVILSLVLSCKKSHTVSGVWRFDDLKEMTSFLGIQGHKYYRYCMTMNEEAQEARVYFFDSKQKEGYRLSLKKIEPYRYVLMSEKGRKRVFRLKVPWILAIFEDIKHIHSSGYEGDHYDGSLGKEAEYLQKCMDDRIKIFKLNQSIGCEPGECDDPTSP